MTPTVLLTLTLVLVATSSIAIAAESTTDGAHRQIRTTDARLRRLLVEGMRTSPTLRALVERLEASDVVVYLRCDGNRLVWDGRLTFVSSAGGYRYVVVRVARLTSPASQIAIMAHELRHAVEIADAPDIVDGPSLVREYRRIGYVSSGTSVAGIAFDSRAAVEAGVQVLSELRGEGED